MKITKFNHSCVLVETEDRVGLFDPGGWSWQSGSFDIDKIDRIDRIIITHAHGDHFDPEFLKTVLDKFPQAHLVANEEVQQAVKAAGIDVTMRGQETACAKPFTAPHEGLPTGTPPPANTGFHFKSVFTHPGDSHTFDESMDVLALPVIAPWGSTVRAVELAKRLKPKHIIPIHDWHHSNEGRQWLYGLLTEVFETEGITFHSLEDGVPIEIV